MPDFEVMQRSTRNRDVDFGSSNVHTTHVNELTKEEKVAIEETQKIALEAVRQTESSSSQKIPSAVMVEEKNPEVTKIAIQAGIVQENDNEPFVTIAIKADVVQDQTPAATDADPVKTTNELPEVAMKADQEPSETLKEVQTHLGKELDLAREKKDQAKMNYLVQMNRLIAELTILLNEWTCRDNARTEASKLKYSEGSATIQENHYTKGTWNLVFGALGAAMGLYPPTQALANPLNTLAMSFNARMDANTTKPSQENSMILQKMQHDKESSSSNTNMADLARRLLDEARQIDITAARHS